MKYKYCILFLTFILTQSAFAGGEWFRLYKQGVDAMKAQNYQDAITKFEEAIAKKSEDARKIRTYGMHFIQYFPNREIGIAHYHLGNMSEARKYLQISLRQEPSPRAKEFLNKTTSGDGPKQLPPGGVIIPVEKSKPAAADKVKPAASNKAIKLVGERMGIAVLPFENNSKYPDLSDIVLDKMITSLFSKSRFNVVERSQLEKILEEQKLGASGLIDVSSAAEFGRGLGVDAIILGSVSASGQGALSIDARAIDTESAAIIVAHDAYSSRADAQSVKSTIDFLAEKFVNSLPLVEGSVIRIDAGSIMLDVGRDGGIKKGIKCVIYREGAEVKHPVSGEILGKETLIVGQVKITDPFNKYSSALIVKLENGQTIAVGDKFLTK